MNKGMVKVQKVGWRTDLRNSEVDGHLLAKKMIEDFEVGGERPSLEFLEFSNSTAARKEELGL